MRLSALSIDGISIVIRKFILGFNLVINEDGITLLEEEILRFGLNEVLDMKNEKLLYKTDLRVYFDWSAFEILISQTFRYEGARAIPFSKVFPQNLQF